MSDTSRQCGPCSACCYVPPVPEVQKPACSACPHVVEGLGCGIYAERPQRCADYACLWLQDPGLLLEEHRPDLLGLIVDVQQLPSGRQVLRLMEVWPDAMASDRAQQLATALAQATTVSIIRHGDTFATLVMHKGTIMEREHPPMDEEATDGP